MMDSNQQPYFSDEQGREFQSFGSSCHPRKISIGILMDSFTEPRPKDVTIQTEENVTPRANHVEDGKNMQGVLYTSKSKQSKPLEHEISPWLSSRSFHQKLSMSEQVHRAKPTPIFLATTPKSETHNRVHVAKVLPVNSFMHFIPNQMSILDSHKASLRKVDQDDLATTDGTVVGVENILFATQKSMPEEEVEEHQTTIPETKGSETLRTKLWEILGTISSPNKQNADEHDINTEGKNMKLLQNNDEECAPVAKPRQNSDTIETDSECLDLSVGRPMTRSLTRRKAADKLKSSKMENAQSTYYKKENQEGSNSFIKEGFSRRLHYAVSGGSLTFMRKRSKRRSPRIPARIMSSHELENPGRNQPVKSRGKTRSEKMLLHANGVKDNDNIHQRKDSEFIKPKSVTLQIDSHQVHVKYVPKHLRNIVHPKLQENVEPGQPADKNFDNHSPIFGVINPEERYIPDYPPSRMTKPAEESSPGSPPKTKSGEADGNGPAKMISNKKVIKSFESFLSSRSNYANSDSEPNACDYAGRIENSPLVKPKCSMEEEPESGLSLSSSEDSDLETFKDGSQAKDFGKSRLISPEISTIQKLGFVLHQKKKHHYWETGKASEFSPTFLSRKVVEDSSKLRQQLDLNEGDELASAVSLFASALERVKSKLKSMVRKRSAEILISVAESIQLQLQSTETQMQADMVKLTSTNQSKRKRLNMRFEELEGELNVIHARLKDEVNRHFQDCRYTLEVLDAHQMELKGALEKQSVSHRKLLLQAEEAIETQLNDAQRRITEVHNLAREKMFQLKDVMVDCF